MTSTRVFRSLVHRLLLVVLDGLLMHPWSLISRFRPAAFVERFTTQAKADWLSPKRLGDWLTKIGYSGKVA